MEFILKLYTLLSLSSASASSALAAESIKSIKFEGLQSFAQHSLPSDQAFVLYFFQPNCPSCARQKKDLACLPEDTRVVSIGVFGSKRELSKEAKKTSLDGLLLYGGKKAENFFNVRQTPTLLFYSRTGKQIRRVEAWLPCAELRKLKND